MTYSDKTVYPVASRNDKDFRNLVDVYLDAVFYPNTYKNPFTLRQEGWHYEFDEAGQLVYNGVVYNEMKGVYSSPDAVEENEVNKALFPDTPYRFESGGYPEEIPTLTQEMFLDFHKTYYSPQNSFIYLYGNMDIDAYLSYLDEAYLSHFDKDPDFSVKIPLQAPFDRTKEVTAYYPEAQGVDVDHKTYLSLNIVMDQALTRNRPWPLKSLQRSFLKAITPPCALPSCGPVSAAMYQAAQCLPAPARSFYPH